MALHQPTNSFWFLFIGFYHREIVGKECVRINLRSDTETSTHASPMLFTLTPNPPYKHRERGTESENWRERLREFPFSLLSYAAEHRPMEINKFRQLVKHWKIPGVFLVHSNNKLKKGDIKQNVPACLFYIMTTAVFGPHLNSLNGKE